MNAQMDCESKKKEKKREKQKEETLIDAKKDISTRLWKKFTLKK